MFANAFADEMPTAFPIYTDPGRETFRAFAMKRSKTGLFKPATWRNAARAMKAGHRQKSVQGDPFQDGGVVVVRPGGEVVFTHIEQQSGDLADLDAVIAALA